MNVAQVDWTALGLGTWWEATFAFAKRKLKAVDAIGKIDWSSVHTAIDIGGGPGLVSFDMIERGVAEVTCLEIMPFLIEAGKKVAAELALQHSPVFIEADITQFDPSKIAPIDLVIMLGVYHYFSYLMAREMLTKIFWMSRKYVLLEGRSIAREGRVVEIREKGYGGINSTVSVPSHDWLISEAHSSGYILRGEPQQVGDERWVMLFERMLEIKLSWAETDLSNFSPNTILDVPTDHPMLASAIKEKLPDVYFRINETKVEPVMGELRHNFHPWLFLPIQFSIAEKRVVDGVHRLSFAKERGRQSVKVIVA
jgi:SAM-dependent methyltransferase